MLRRLFFKKTNNPIKLGRWGTSINREDEKNNSENYLQADLSNHDHCGSDICGPPTTLPTSPKKLNKIQNQNRKYFSVLTNNDEYYLPFLIPSWHVNFENKNKDIDKKKSKKEVENWSKFLKKKKKKKQIKNNNKKIKL